MYVCMNECLRMSPAIDAKIPIFIRNTFEPTHPGTRIFLPPAKADCFYICACIVWYICMYVCMYVCSYIRMYGRAKRSENVRCVGSLL